MVLYVTTSGFIPLASISHTSSFASSNLPRMQ
uniref:Uncharacterized protein n=1 Tax=Arundo donax TaxID=35708 RepID=A0A0A9AE39_ARUDO